MRARRGRPSRRSSAGNGGGSEVREAWKMGPPPTVGPPTEVTGRVRIAAECMRLESARRETVRGFESHTLRRMFRFERRVAARSAAFVMFGRRQAEGGGWRPHPRELTGWQAGELPPVENGATRCADCAV